MPPPELERLDQYHQEQQRINAVATAALILKLWRSVRPDDISGTGAEWLKLAVQAIVSGREKSNQLALAYFLTVRKLLVPRAPFLIVPSLPPPNLEQFTTSLRVTGLANAANRIEAVPERDEIPDDAKSRTPEGLRQEAMELAGEAAAAAAVRHVQNGGRSFIDEAVKKDPVAIGWVRIPRSEKPCYFCAMLASRGPVYSEESFDQSDPRFEGPGEYKVHDSCHCTMRQVYSRRRDEWPAISAELEQLWADSTVGTSGEEMVRAFRRAYEGRAAA